MGVESLKSHNVEDQDSTNKPIFGVEPFVAPVGIPENPPLDQDDELE